MRAVSKAMTLSEWDMLLLLSMLLGGAFFFVRVAVRWLLPFTVVALRVVLVAAMLTSVVYLSGSQLIALQMMKR